MERQVKGVMKQSVKKASRSLTNPDRAAIKSSQAKKDSRIVSSPGVVKKKTPAPRRSIPKMPALEMENVGKLARQKKLTILERKSVSVEINHQYQGYYEKFKAFCLENGVCWPVSQVDADPTLADFLDVLFLEGRSPAEGEKIIAAVEFHRIDLKSKLVRSKRALKGWRKTMPAHSRLPLPRLALKGIAMDLLSRGFRDMCLLCLVAFDLYLRPGEAIELKSKNVVAPVKRAGRQYQWVMVIIREEEGMKPDKTGIFDNSLPIDRPELRWVGNALLQKARACNSKEDGLWAFSMDQFRKEFVKSGMNLGLENLHPYQMRHGGATEDLTAKFRDHNGVKSRGRWRTDASVRRYAKVGKVQQLLSRMTECSVRFCQWSEQNLDRAFLGVIPPRSAKM